MKDKKGKKKISKDTKKAKKTKKDLKKSTIRRCSVHLLYSCLVGGLNGAFFGKLIVSIVVYL
jgi:hypothetical protein